MHWILKSKIGSTNNEWHLTNRKILQMQKYNRFKLKNTVLLFIIFALLCTAKKKHSVVHKAKIHKKENLNNKPCLKILFIFCCCLCLLKNFPAGIFPPPPPTPFELFRKPTEKYFYNIYILCYNESRCWNIKSTNNNGKHTVHSILIFSTFARVFWLWEFE